MKPPRAPSLDTRRTREFSQELRERARVWMPGWASGDVEGDFGRALIEIAARFNSEVAERLDGAGEKLRRGFLDWLGVQGEATRPARMPVVFKLADTAEEPVLASPPVRMQVDADGTSVIFEADAETDLRLVPGKLDMIVGVDADGDAIYFSPPGLSDLQPLEQLPSQWSLKSFASAGSLKLQLDPDVGLVKGMIIEAAGRHYRIDEVENGIATIDPPLGAGLDANLVVRKVEAFAPFNKVTRNRQEHALYIGHNDLLNIEAAATIDVVGAATLADGVEWQYWGKTASEPNADPAWQTLVIGVPKPDALVLKKPKGEIEPRKIGEINSRWIRAVRKSLQDPSKYFTTDALELRINCVESLPCQKSDGISSTSPVAEGLANTTPLVLNKVFFPLGKQPRQFDSFYLGSKETFSKVAAEVDLCFELADPTFFAFSAVRQGNFADGVLAGIAKDRALHLVKVDPITGKLTKLFEREPLQPPVPDFDDKGKTGPPVALDKPFPPIDAPSGWPQFRPPVWSAGTLGVPVGFQVAVSAGNTIWIWKEHPTDRHQSGWVNFGSILETTPPATDLEPVSGLVYLDGISTLFALRNGRLFARTWPNGAGWSDVKTEDGTNTIRLASIVPVMDEGAGLQTSSSGMMVGVSETNVLYSVTNLGFCKKISSLMADTTVRPNAVMNSAGKLVVAFATPSRQDIVMYHELHGEAKLEFTEPDASVIGFEATITATRSQFFASVSAGDGAFVASWLPQVSSVSKISFSQSTTAEGLGAVGGIPTAISKHVVIPGTRGVSFSADYVSSRRYEGNASILAGVVVPPTLSNLIPNDVFMRLNGGTPEKRTITGSGFAKDAQVLFPIDSTFTSSTANSVLAYQATSPQTGNAISAHELKLDPQDVDAAVGSFILINGNFHKILNLNKTTSPWVADVSTPPLLPAGMMVSYAKPLAIAGKAAHYLSLNSTNNQWDISLLKRQNLVFPGASPERQAAVIFHDDGAGHPLIAALKKEFATLPSGNPNFVLDATLGTWKQNQEDTSANPELSWEYWNGTGWWNLDVTFDDTQNLKSSGRVSFDVPDDIASSDWAGKTNFWIRARLIGGNYGTEKVTFTTTPLSGGRTQQTVDPPTDGIEAPSVLNLGISYRICKPPALPKYVLAEDSGSVVDQSDANRTGAAIVEAFIPVGQMLGRLSREAADAEGPECVPECECQNSDLGEPSGSAASAVVTAVDVIAAQGRALFIGLDANISAGPVSVLLLVEKENDHLDLAPMKVEALVAGKFQPIVADDGTRALSESGVLLMSFVVAPTLSNLFGKTLTWLRLTPKQPSENWIPSIRGAYLNAVFASSKETLTRELLGSSDGSPNLSLRLARPPVLRDTLELRIREPLGEEERTELIADDPDMVRSDVVDLPGEWVLWKQVTDPDDEVSSARVYSLDEATGEIRFGDGIHGRIPPIGRNSIVAFGYSRTESGPIGGVDFPANSVKARTPLNLVSPVESVESVIAADHSAGGAPPESNERVLKTGFASFRHRGRAVSARDLEDIALQSSPDIVQALAVVTHGKIRLVVVMKGRTPTPSAVQARELRRFLLDSSPVAMRAPRALRVEGPGIRKLRVELELVVERLEYAARVSTSVKDEFTRFFDTGIGGIDADGWPLGLCPSEDDIAFVLNDVPLVAGIGDITLRESLADGREGKWPDSLKPTEIVVLDDDPVRITFKAEEVEG